MKFTRRLALRLSLLTLILTLSACDGGLFGTGDGGPIIPVESNAPPGGGDVAAGETGGAGDNGNSSDPNTTPSMPGSGSDSMSPTSFENLDVSTRDPDALVNVLNFSSSNLMVRVDSADMDSEIIPPGSSSPALRIAPDTRILSLVDSSDLTLFSFEPFTAASQSLSTVIVRETDSGISVRAVRSDTATDDASLAKVRLIQIGQLGDASATSVISLQAGGSNPGSSDIQFPDVNFSVNPVTDYISTTSGDYVLTDALDRLSPFPVTFVGGKVYTILLVGNAVPSVIVMVDSDLID